MSKRKRFLITSLLLTAGFAVIQLFQSDYRYISILGLSVFSVGLFIWSLKEGLGFDMTLSSLIAPFLFTLGVGFFWFLLPGSVFAQIPILLVYGFGIYVLCLTMNIYTVSAIRTIALLRAARGVGFVLTLFTAFLLYNAAFSLRVNYMFVFMMTAISSLALYFQGYWSYNLEKIYSSKVMGYSIISSVLSGEVAIMLFFYPLSVLTSSLIVTLTTYLLLGLGQSSIEGRLFKNTIKEYLIISFVVLAGLIISSTYL